MEQTWLFNLGMATVLEEEKFQIHYIYIYIYTHTHTHRYIYIYIYTHTHRVKLATFVEGNPKVHFSIATTPRCWGGHNSFLWVAPL